jgi:transcriptional regulator with XRE-family HTH domain
MDKLSQARLKQFGQHLQKLRNEKGLSLRELSLKCDIDHKKISDIELNKRGLKLETLFKLADGLELHPKFLLDFEYATE